MGIKVMIPKYESTHQSSRKFYTNTTFKFIIHYSVSASSFPLPEINTIDCPSSASSDLEPDIVENGKQENSQHISLYLLTPFDTTTELSLVVTNNSDPKIQFWSHFMPIDLYRYIASHFLIVWHFFKIFLFSNIFIGNCC